MFTEEKRDAYVMARLVWELERELGAGIASQIVREAREKARELFPDEGQSDA